MNTIRKFGILRKPVRNMSLTGLLGVILIGCGSSKISETESGSQQMAVKPGESVGQHAISQSVAPKVFGMDEHFEIWAEADTIAAALSDSTEILTQIPDSLVEREIISNDSTADGSKKTDLLKKGSAVAQKIVENYVTSKDKEPGGHCLAVSKRRFERAYESVHGHSFYDDLPRSMATAYYSPEEVFDYLYVSASGIHEGWRNLPIEYRGKGNAGAIAYAGMGTLIDKEGIWNGELRPGAPMQVWKDREDYEKVVRGANVKEFDPFGHSFIFISYVRDDENNIIGIRIADQGYQSYRPLIPNDYEVWWAVNLNI
ncbi:hypothetical protein ACT6NV_13235 [Robiginitalea sp. IMCC44478]|uniref:hypothetical protein n=1 Tax=Robiginitalea sp. IMCC44478 TaxID=3459122 RepID=UPI004040F833